MRLKKRGNQEAGDASREDCIPLAGCTTITRQVEWGRAMLAHGGTNSYLPASVTCKVIKVVGVNCERLSG